MWATFAGLTLGALGTVGAISTRWTAWALGADITLGTRWALLTLVTLWTGNTRSTGGPLLAG